FEAERLGSLAIQDELKFRYPLDRKISGVGPLKNLVHEEGRTTKNCNNVCSIAQNTAGAGDFLRTNRKKASPCSQSHNRPDVAKSQGIVAGLDRLAVRLFHFLE